MKSFTLIILFSLISYFSFSQDFNDNRKRLPSAFKIHLSTGGSFLSDIKSEYSRSTSSLAFIEGGIEVGRKVNLEVNFRRTFANSEIPDLRYTQLHFGLNSKSFLNKKLALVFRVGGGFGIENKASGFEGQTLRVGLGLENKVTNFIKTTFNLGHDFSNSVIYNGFYCSAGIKFSN